MQIVVLAMHRSGTSTVAGLIHRMGAYTGDESVIMPATDDNPKGYFERNDVVSLNDRILASLNCEWDKPDRWPDRPEPTDAFDNEMRAIVADLDRHPVWMMKDPRQCLTWPWWARHVARPVFVLVHRDPVEVARSLKTRDGMSLPFGVALWEAYTVGALAAADGHPTIRVNYHALLRDPVGESRALHAALAAVSDVPLLPFDEAAALEFVTPGLNRSGKQADMADQLMNPAQMRLAQQFGAGESPSEPPTLSVGGRAALEDRSRYEALLARFQSLSTEHERLRFIEAELCQQGERRDDRGAKAGYLDRLRRWIGLSGLL